MWVQRCNRRGWWSATLLLSFAKSVLLLLRVAIAGAGSFPSGDSLAVATASMAEVVGWVASAASVLPRPPPPH